MTSSLMPIGIAVLSALAMTRPADADERRPPPTAAEGRDPFPLDLAFTRRATFEFEKAAVSPSGAHLAYAVCTPAKYPDGWWTMPSGLPTPMLGSRLHVVELAGGHDLALGAEGANSFSPSWSPDGRKLAYYSDEGGTLRLWTFDVAEGKARPAADLRLKVPDYGPTPVMPPTWGPDGRRVLVPALPADEAGADPRTLRATSRAPADAGKDGAGPDSDVLVLTSGAEPARPEAPRKRTAGHLESAVDVTAVDLDGGTARVLIPAQSPDWWEPAAFASYSPSGRFLAYVSRMRQPPGHEARFVVDVGVFPVGEARPLHVEEVARTYHGREAYSGDHLGRSGVILAWHPTKDILLFVNDLGLRRLDCTGGAEPRATTLAPGWGKVNGGYLAFTRDGASALIGLLPPDENSDSHRTGALGVVPLDGGPVRTLSLPEGFRSGQVVRRDRVSLWQPVADTATFLDRDADPSRTLVRRVNLANGEWTTVRDEPATVELHGMPRDESFLVGVVRSSTRPPDFHRLGPDFAPRGRLTTIEPRLEGRELGSVETFRTAVPLHDGRFKEVRTAVLLPPGARKGDRLPAILTLYGGYDMSQMVRGYGGGSVSTIPAPVFSTRGFAVLLADAPLGPEGRPGNPVDELRDAIVPQVYRAAELGYIDLRRVAVTGQSYGGYCTAALVSATNLFRAAIAVSGTYDLTGIYGLLRADGTDSFVGWAESDQGRMGQPPWSDLRRYLDNSPYDRADRILTPLLLLHGRDDATCPVGEAKKMFVALRRLGRTAQLAVYEREGHVISEWEPKHAIDATDRMLEFLRRHLGTDPVRAAAR